MTPFEIGIAIHYFGCVKDYRDGDFSAPLLPPTLDWFVEQGLLEEQLQTEGQPRYKRTDRLGAFVAALCEMPLPVQVWTVPDERSTQ